MYDHHSVFKREEIMLDSYERIRSLGRGAYGEVHLARHLDTLEKVAIKVVDRRQCKKDSQRTHSKNEKKVCEMFATKLNHANIVSFYDVLERDNRIYFVMEHVQGGTLYDMMQYQGKIKEEQAKVWIRELISALAYIHEHGIIHRDLKPENILLDTRGQIRLCDFGFSDCIQDSRKLQELYCGSPYYAAPEMVSGTPYRGPPVDMWSCGVILYLMFTGCMPFHSHIMYRLFEQIIRGKYAEVPGISPKARQFLKALLNFNPEKRMTAQEALKHPWLKEKKIKTSLRLSFNSLFSKKSAPPSPLEPWPMYSSDSYQLFVPPVPSITFGESPSTYKSKTIRSLFQSVKASTKKQTIKTNQQVCEFFTRTHKKALF